MARTTAPTSHRVHHHDERHDNVIIDVARVPALLASERIDTTVRDAFGHEQLPVGLKVVVGIRR